MKKLSIMIKVFFLTNILFSQNNYPFEVNNIKTDKHINIEGTRLYIIPPKDFVQGGGIVGFHKDKKAFIQVVGVLGGDFYKNAATFNKLGLQKEGLTVTDFQYIKIQEYSGRFAEVKVPNINQGFLIVFGDTTLSVSISSVIPVGEEKYINEILNSLKSIYYDRNLKLGNSNKDFECNDKNTLFKFAKNVANLSIYSINGIAKETYGDEPIIMITPMPKGESTTLEQVAAQFVSKFEKYGHKEIKWSNKRNFKRNNQDVFEFELTSKLNNNDSNSYFQIVGNQEKAIVIFCASSNEYIKYLQDFKELANSVRLK
jgi:hypothetical protein